MAVKTVQAIINGVTTTLTYNSGTGKYEATVTAPSTSSYNNNDGHYYPVTVKATDEAGNVTTKNDTDVTLGNSLKLKVKEKSGSGDYNYQSDGIGKAYQQQAADCIYRHGCGFRGQSRYY
nr:MAG TPA: hypothetical protein [Caudoviricetes sp.]